MPLPTDQAAAEVGAEGLPTTTEVVPPARNGAMLEADRQRPTADVQPFVRNTMNASIMTTVVANGDPMSATMAAPADDQDKASDKAPSWATPSKLTLDEAAKASIGSGRYATERRALQEAISDPRLGICPLPVKLLAAVTEHINGKTGVAFPKVSTLAEEIVNHLNGLPAAYRLPALHNAVTLIRQCGYFVTEKRAPQVGMKAVVHYAITYPSEEEKRAGIEAWGAEKQGNELGAELTRGVNSADLTGGMKSGSDFTGGMKSGGADFTRGRALTSPVDRKSGGPSLYTEPDNINPYTAASEEAADASLPFRDPGQAPSDGARRNKKRAAPVTPIAPDWRPTELLIAWVKARWIATDRQISTEAEKFREYHAGKGNEMASWDSAWRTWWLNGFHKIPRRPDGDADADSKRATKQLAEDLAEARRINEELARAER